MKILTKDGSCQPCGEYTRKQSEQVCGPDKCSTDEKLLPNGKCEKCGPYTKKHSEKICKADKCSDR